MVRQEEEIDVEKKGESSQTERQKYYIGPNE
jgi:hypothetical protein